MKDKFFKWAQESRLEVKETWTLEQICDAWIAAGLLWPVRMTNEEAWQFWTAKLRAEMAIASIQWSEQTDRKRRVTFRFEDRRVYEVEFPETDLRGHFGTLCKNLEEKVRGYKIASDLEREAELVKIDGDYEGVMPDVVEYVIGFRAWAVSGYDLRPIGQGSNSWRGGQEVRASCGYGKVHRSPDPNCECGLYAWHSWSEIANSRQPSQVTGAVAACGRMEIHRKGFRAEYMKPVLLAYDDSTDAAEQSIMGFPPGPDYHRVKEYADRLGIPLVGASKMVEAAREFGLIVGENPHLLPEVDEVETNKEEEAA